MPNLTPESLGLQSALAGEYSLERELGRGGMGIVYLARDVQLDRDVAIKVLPPQLALQAKLRERFLREARMAASLSHPHIVPIHRVGEVGGYVFFVMSYVPGETLGERLRREGPLPPADASRVLREVAWALAYAHGRGIVHRDVKPDNILLEAGTGRALVADFGIARGAATEASDPGKVMGTVSFMSPEQSANGAVDARSDLYSLGVVGYLAVSGRLPFGESKLPALLAAHQSERAPALRDAAPGVPAALAATIDRCLARDPSARFASGEAMADALAVVEPRGVLPAPLRSWLGVRNPAAAAYLVWSGLCVGTVLLDVVVSLGLHSSPSYGAMVIGTLLAMAPLIPSIGFHAKQAKRLFELGFTLEDLRTALAVAERERREGLASTRETLGWRSRVLQIATYGSAATSLAALGNAMVHIQLGEWSERFVIPGLISAALAVVANMVDVPLLPERVRRFFKTSLRDRLWKGRDGELLARRLGAPSTSRVIGDGVFRPTEVVLGGAAADLFAALPESHRKHLGDLPAVVAELESRAAEARAQMERLDQLAAHGADAELHTRREQTKQQLAAAVAALEGIRLDLIRLHAGASDLAPLTTLLDAARDAGAEIALLSDAQREVGRMLGRAAPAIERRAPTPV